MLNGKSFLAIIPARGGSKRLRNKNKLELVGKPLIAWTIEAALKSVYVDEVVVTTDNQEIANIAKQYNASVPFMRPIGLASDDATTFDVVKHTVDFYENKGIIFDFILLLQPTSPIRGVKDIDNAILLLDTKNADAIISTTEMEHSPLWSNVLPYDGNMRGFLKNSVKNKRSQDLPTYYRVNGAIYLISKSELLIEKTFFLEEKSFSYVMDKESSVDIDEYFDFQLAELILENKLKLLC